MVTTSSTLSIRIRIVAVGIVLSLVVQYSCLGTDRTWRHPGYRGRCNPGGDSRRRRDATHVDTGVFRTT